MFRVENSLHRCEAAYWNEVAWQHAAIDFHYGAMTQIGQPVTRTYSTYKQQKYVTKKTTWILLDDEPRPMC